jgi:ABC-type transport system involved in cytochrome c biogenesis permease subunit
MSFGVEVGLLWAAVVIYGAATALLASGVVFDGPARTRWALRLGTAGLLPHAVAIVMRWVAVGHGPYMMKYEVLSSNAWIAVAALLLFLRRRPAWVALALVVLPAALLAMGLGLFSSPEARELPPSLRSIWLIFHIALAKVSLASFLLSTASAVLQLLELRPNATGWRARLPPLEALDAYTVRFVGFGMITWTVTIAAGSVWAHQAWGRYWGWDAIETWSLIAWIAYGTFLHVRRFYRPGPRATAWWSIGCFAVFVLALLILPFVAPSMHSAYFQ